MAAYHVSKRFLSTYAVAAGLLCAVVFACPAFLARADDQATDPVVVQPDWPQGLRELLSREGRVYGCSFHASDLFFFTGDTKAFNEFLAGYANLKNTPLTLAIHPGRGIIPSPIEREKQITCTWLVEVLRVGWSKEVETSAAEQGNYFVAVHLWLGGEVELYEIEAPLAIEVISGNEIEEFVAAHQKKRIEARPSEQPPSEGEEGPGSVVANEQAAINTLRSLPAGQVNFQGRLACDEDGDGQGEFGFFQEMTGAIAPRDGSTMRKPGEFCPSTFFGIVNANGQVTYSGYLFQMWLPDGTGNNTFVTEGDGVVPALGKGNADEAENFWVCYAWPVERNKTGVRAFVISVDGSIFFKNNDDAATCPYDGPDNPPLATAAFVIDNNGNLVFPDASVNNIANDGDAWYMKGEL